MILKNVKNSGFEGSISPLQNLFRKENFPIPIGFNNHDVNVNAPKLFSDTYVLMYLFWAWQQMQQLSVLLLGLVTHSDIVSFHKEVLREAVKLQDLTRELMLKQGTYDANRIFTA